MSNGDRMQLLRNDSTGRGELRKAINRMRQSGIEPKNLVPTSLRIARNYANNNDLEEEWEINRNTQHFDVNRAKAMRAFGVQVKNFKEKHGQWGVNTMLAVPNNAQLNKMIDNNINKRNQAKQHSQDTNHALRDLYRYQ